MQESEHLVPVVSLGRAALIFGAYATLGLVLAALTLTRRDVTV